MKQNVNQNEVRVKCIDAWSKHDIEPNSPKQFIAQAEKSVDNKPKKKLQEVRTRNFGYAMPHYAGGGSDGRSVEPIDGEILYILRVEVNLTRMVPDQPFEQFSECPLGAVAPVDKRGQDCDPQVN